MSWRIGGDSYESAARPLGGGRFSVLIGAREVEVAARVERDELVMELDGRVVRVALSRRGDERWLTLDRATVFAKKASAKARGASDAHGNMEAPMPGRIVRVAVAVGDRVTKGQTVVTLEAMKMEHALKAPRDGVVRAVGCEEGELVQAGVALVVLEPQVKAPSKDG